MPVDLTDLSSSWATPATSMAISIDVTTFDLGHVNDLNDDVVVEVDVEVALKSSIFIVQKAAAPKSGVEFRQDSIGTIRSCLATSYGA